MMLLCVVVVVMVVVAGDGTGTPKDAQLSLKHKRTYDSDFVVDLLRTHSRVRLQGQAGLSSVPSLSKRWWEGV